MLELEINTFIPVDDFYLQWDYIFWWHVRFQLNCLMWDTFEKIGSDESGLLCSSRSLF